MSTRQEQIDPKIKFLKEISALIDSVGDLDKLLYIIIQTATKEMEAKASTLPLFSYNTKQLFFHPPNIKIKIKVPEHITDKQRKLLEELAKEGM